MPKLIRSYNKKIRVLSLDGGGIRGIVSCIILGYLENQIKIKSENPDAKIGDYFDLIAGTSTGGLIASVLLVKDEDGNAKYSIQSALDLYTEKGSDIFAVDFWEKLGNPLGLFDEKISSKNLEKELDRFFGEISLRDFTKPCLITSYDLENRCAKLFNSLDGHSDVKNFYIKDVCRATSAAPTYFEPAIIKSFSGQELALIDGGVYANNPALCAYAEARKIKFSEALKDERKPDYPNLNEMIIVSIGTGTVLEPYSGKKMKKAGVVEWVQPLIDILLSANAETVDYQLRQMYQALSGRNQKNYIRIEPDLKKASPKMDKASKDNIAALIQTGLTYVDQNQEDLDELVDKLIHNH